MHKLAELCVRRPVFATMLVLSLTVVGVYSFFGLGVAFCNWLSIIATTGIVAIGLAYRISVEEEALLSALGDDYRAYAAKTKRLVPGVF